MLTDELDLAMSNAPKSKGQTMTLDDPAFVAMNGRDKWETLVLNRLISTDEPTFVAMRDTLRAEASRLLAMQEALEDLEKRATATLSAVDRYNEKNGTYIIGPSLLQLGKSIAKARAILSPNRSGGGE
jgi:hypothetical protein